MGNAALPTSWLVAVIFDLFGGVFHLESKQTSPKSLKISLPVCKIWEKAVASVLIFPLEMQDI